MPDGLEHPKNVIIIVDKKQFKLHVINPGVGTDDPKRIHVCRCAIGMEGYATPKDEYKTGARTREPDWKAPDWAEQPLQPGAVYKFGTMFNPYEYGLISIHAFDSKGDERTGYAMHGTKNEASIPGRASHGCIRLLKKDILWLYDNIPDNTLVIVR